MGGTGQMRLAGDLYRTNYGHRQLDSLAWPGLDLFHAPCVSPDGSSAVQCSAVQCSAVQLDSLAWPGVLGPGFLAWRLKWQSSDKLSV
jgi:hypothetical protein